MKAILEFDPTGYLDGMPADQYHAHPSLSSSGVRALLPPKTPAHFRYERDHPKTPTRDMELGTVTHTHLLGVGTEAYITKSEDWRTKGSRDEIEDARNAGLIVVKPSEARLVLGMEHAVRAHPLAGPLLAEGTGVPERALFWRDPATGVDCRALIDFSPQNRASLVDLKTCGDASPAALPRHMSRYGYDVQAAHYLRGARTLGLADQETEFVWVFVERDPPHLVTVARLTPDDLAYADGRCEQAYRTYAECVEAGFWPGYGDGIATITLPGWARRDHELPQDGDEYSW